MSENSISDQRKKRDSAKVYFNPTNKQFVVIQEAKRGVAKAEVGVPISISDAEFDERISAIVLRALDNFQTNIYSDETARRGDPEQNRRFIHDHLSVTVERLTSGDVMIYPMHHERGGYTGTRSEQIRLSRAEVPEKLPAALREGFRIAT